MDSRTIYQDIAQDYRKSIHSMLLEERVQEFLRLREDNGYLVDFENQPTGWTISECHSPIADLLKEFPILWISLKKHFPRYGQSLSTLRSTAIRRLRINCSVRNRAYLLTTSCVRCWRRIDTRTYFRSTTASFVIRPKSRW